MLVKVEGKSRQDESKERDQDGCCHRAAVGVGAGGIDRHGHRACEHKMFSTSFNYYFFFITYCRQAKVEFEKL